MGTQRTILLGVFLACSAGTLHANPLLFEDFEKYNLGALDANLNSTNGVNQAPNGQTGANPWWGAEPPNLQVVSSENGITPHSGVKMVRGASGNTTAYSQDLCNLAYRFNGGKPFFGNCFLDWWFYDPAGTNSQASQFNDSISLAYYPDLPGTNDYSDSNFFGFDAKEQLALGAASEHGAGYNPAKYQAQVVGATNAYDGPRAGFGWINTTVNRSLGWHHARIALAPVQTNGTANVSFYIDDLIHPTLTNNTVFTNGFNCLEVDARFGNLTAYYDDITFDVVRATLNLRAAGNNAVLTWPAGWTLQSSTNLVSSFFVDVPFAFSPYTNQITGRQRFFRLRIGTPAPPVLAIVIAGRVAVINFPSGWILQTSTNLAGLNKGFVDVINALPPFSSLMTAGPHYYRLRN